MRRRFDLRWVLLLAAGCVIAVTARTALAAPQQTAGGAEPKIGEYVGPGGCGGANCHNEAQPGTEYDILQTELATWQNEDAHRHGYNDLLNDDSKRIARNMGLQAPAQRSQLCLDCHSLPAGKGREDILQMGVSCEGCHGPSGGWLQGHARRSWTHDQSVAKGMIDLRDLSVRATTCLRCHLGDATREVDHELLAAGHPELVFELSYYTEAANGAAPHWKLFDTLQDQTGRRDTHGVVSWAVGQIEALREGLELLELRYRASGWPEFTEMTCDTCHHSLADSKWRQERGYRYTAGLPPWNLARWAVARHLIKEVAPDDYEALEREINAIGRGATLNDATKEAMSASIGNAKRILGRAKPKADRADYDRNRVKKLVLAIAGDAELLREIDLQSAAQVVFSLDSLIQGLDRVSPQPVSDDVFDTLDALLDEYEKNDRFDRRRFSTALESLGQKLR